MFEKFWQLYPRKVGKLAARREWERAVRTAQAEGQTVEDILKGVERYRRSVVDKETQFICHPRTWLHQGRWMDEDEAPKPEARSDMSTEYVTVSEEVWAAYSKAHPQQAARARDRSLPRWLAEKYEREIPRLRIVG